MSLGLCSFLDQPLLPRPLVFTNEVGAHGAVGNLLAAPLVCFGVGVRMGNGTSSWIS
jgi:hypothetical protein